MRCFFKVLAVFLCLCTLLAGCGAPAPTQTEQPSAEVSATAASDSVKYSPVPDGAAPAEEPAPREEPSGQFFDDAAFIGDSISYSLMLHHIRTKDFGQAVFLVSDSLGVHNSLSGRLTVSYQGVSMSPWDALAACGAKKAFLMLGINDIGYIGVEDTIVAWSAFLENIRSVCPDIEIYLQALTPMWNGAEQKLLNNETIDLYNAQLRQFASQNGCHFLDFSFYFKNSENGMAEEYTSDRYVHMNSSGITAWADLLKAYATAKELEVS